LPIPVLADEINRAPAKAHVLLEAMQEKRDYINTTLNDRPS
jgi:MoxR-like ATPase